MGPIEKGISVLPKTVSKARMQQNIDVFDFELTREDMDHIAALGKGESSFFSHTDPQMVEYLTGLKR
jgi:2,5-diketo-D-gluconate reductase A